MSTAISHCCGFREGSCVSSLISRSIVLATARLMNQVLLMLSPIVLVRLLEISEYGRYRQFTVTAMFVISIAGFSIAGNINYFVARFPQRAATYITNSCLLLLAGSSLAGLALLIGRQWLVPEEIAEYWLLLLMYILLFLNLDLVTSYWLANRRSDQVMIYSLSVTMLRLGAVLGAAFAFRDVAMIIIAIVLAEAAKGLCIYGWLRARRLLLFQWDGIALREQLRFIVPHGSGTLLATINENLGKVLVSNRLGPEPLAIYTTAAYHVPILTIVKSALGDVIFPDMVKRSGKNLLDGLRLWKRSNVVLFMLICPAWLLLTYFAEPLIRLLFTEAYVSAAPYFQVFLLMMIRQCFAFSTSLRSIADNRPAVLANLAGLAINAAVILALMPKFGLWGPTLGLVAGQAWVAIYLGRKVMFRYELPLGQLCEWRKLGWILLAGLLAIGTLHLSQQPWPDSPAGTGFGVLVFLAVYTIIVWLAPIDEFHYVLNGLRQQFLRGTKRIDP